jgi:hypothetical protein
MTAGRPREYNRTKIAKDLIDWAKKEDSINLCAFCCLFELDPNCLLEWNRVDEEFSRSYRIAKAYLGARREMQLNKGKLHQLAYAKNSRTYDPFLKNEDQDYSRFEADLNANKAESVPEAVINSNQAVLEQLKEIRRDQSSARNKANTKSNAE